MYRRWRRKGGEGGRGGREEARGESGQGRAEAWTRGKEGRKGSLPAVAALLLPLQERLFFPDHARLRRRDPQARRIRRPFFGPPYRRERRRLEEEGAAALTLGGEDGSLLPGAHISIFSSLTRASQVFSCPLGCLTNGGSRRLRTPLGGDSHPPRDPGKSSVRSRWRRRCCGPASKSIEGTSFSEGVGDLTSGCVARRRIRCLVIFLCVCRSCMGVKKSCFLSPFPLSPSPPLPLWSSFLHDASSSYFSSSSSQLSFPRGTFSLTPIFFRSSFSSSCHSIDALLELFQKSFLNRIRRVVHT